MSTNVVGTNATEGAAVSRFEVRSALDRTLEGVCETLEEARRYVAGLRVELGGGWIVEDVFRPDGDKVVLRDPPAWVTYHDQGPDGFGRRSYTVEWYTEHELDGACACHGSRVAVGSRVYHRRGQCFRAAPRHGYTPGPMPWPPESIPAAGVPEADAAPRRVNLGGLGQGF